MVEDPPPPGKSKDWCIRECKGDDNATVDIKGKQTSLLRQCETVLSYGVIRTLGVNVGGAVVIDRGGPALHVMGSAQALRIAAGVLGLDDFELLITVERWLGNFGIESNRETMKRAHA
ncbi:hypothetical protein MY3296_003507 [Beauveria thailandica]